MKRVALVTALALGTGSCEFAQKHPAVTAGITAGSIGFVGCFADGVDLAPCGVVGASAAVFLGGIAWLATTIFNTEDTMPEPEEGEQEMTRQGAIKVHTHTAPPPVMIDAGVDADAAPPAPTPVAVDAPAD